MRRTILILALGWVLGVAATPVFAKRVALVIGNNIYRNLPSKDQLKNAVNDARAVKAGVTVTVHFIETTLVCLMPPSSCASKSALSP